jgi:hypothetical protein
MGQRCATALGDIASDKKLRASVYERLTERRRLTGKTDEAQTRDLLDEAGLIT